MASSDSLLPDQADWPDELQLGESTIIQPDPMMMSAIGLNYPLEAAVADLVDNSIDAGASSVLVRFVRRGSRLSSLCVVDDGRGMSETQLKDAMALGKRREYKKKDLGHFGLGLKAASLGQAQDLIVVSRAAGSPPCGIRWSRENAGRGFTFDIVEQHSAEMLFARPWFPQVPLTGTVVRWDDVMDFPSARNAITSDTYVEETVPRLRNHLGTVFHRLIAKELLQIIIDVEEPEIRKTGPPQRVKAIDPFGYLRSGRSGYPRTLRVPLDSQTVELKCHIWPPRSSRPEFRVPYSGNQHKGQGFYFYRNDRLLQAGGWNGLVQPDPRLHLARVAVEIDDCLESYLSMNPEKTQIRASEAFIHAVEAAQSNDFDLPSYYGDAIATRLVSRRPAGSRQPVVPPGRGFAPLVRHTIDDELEYLPGFEPIHILWQDFEDDAFMDINLEESVIRLNRHYRWAVTGDRGTSLNDAPLLKAALYLLFNDLFQGQYLGAREKDNVKFWGSILAAAARVESE